MTERRPADPQAARQAIADRLRQFARARPGTQLADLQRQFAYDRLLSRLFVAGRHEWVLKGATAILARAGGRARHTLDVDLYRREGDMIEAEAALRAAAAREAGDGFRFALHPGRRLAHEGGPLRVTVVAYLGATEFSSFHVDLVTGILMTGTPDEMPPLVPIELPGIVRTTYEVYPVADHVADKVCAMLELHPRSSGPPVASTRYRDLADLAVLARATAVGAGDLQVALASEAGRRGLHLPRAFPKPNSAGWRAGYARVVARAAWPVEKDVDAAWDTVRTFLDPVLGGMATGRWNPETLSWSSS
jgi:hypothetical protein